MEERNVLLEFCVDEHSDEIVPQGSSNILLTTYKLVSEVERKLMIKTLIIIV
jgi:hypothetical protein